MNEQVKQAIEKMTDLQKIDFQMLLDKLDLRQAIQNGQEYRARLYAKRLVWFARRKIQLSV